MRYGPSYHERIRCKGINRKSHFCYCGDVEFKRHVRSKYYVCVHQDNSIYE